MTKKNVCNFYEKDCTRLHILMNTEFMAFYYRLSSSSNRIGAHKGGRTELRKFFAPAIVISKKNTHKGGFLKRSAVLTLRDYEL